MGNTIEQYLGAYGDYAVGEKKRFMKLITFNIWGGRVREPLFDFIKNHQEIDIFCFQELYNQAKDKMSDDKKFDASLNIYPELRELLPDHQSFFRPHIGTVYGIGIFVKKNIDVLEEGDISIYHVENYPGSGGNHSRNMQWVKIKIGGKIYAILNVHGLWNGKGKTDSPERIAQSETIRKFMDTLDTPKILCGDFNLKPDTKSIEILEKGMNNLVKIYGVKSTRTSYYEKAEKFADYIFVSPDVTVKDFQVLPDEASDHSPLLLEF